MPGRPTSKQGQALNLDKTSINNLSYTFNLLIPKISRQTPKHQSKLEPKFSRDGRQYFTKLDEIRPPTSPEIGVSDWSVRLRNGFELSTSPETTVRKRKKGETNVT